MEQSTNVLLLEIRNDIARRLDRIEDKVDQKANHADLRELETRIRRVELRAVMHDAPQWKELDELKQDLLTPDRVAKLVEDALREAKARGWTARERMMGIGFFIFTTLNAFIGVFTLVNN